MYFLAENSMDWTYIIVIAILFGGFSLVARMWDSFCGIFKPKSRKKRLPEDEYEDYDE
jgi:hypothetical protein